MSKFKYDNERDRFGNGFDSGTIVEGKITVDPTTCEYVVMDEDGVALSTQAVFKSLEGKRVRITCVSLDALDALQKMLEGAGAEVS